MDVDVHVSLPSYWKYQVLIVNVVKHGLCCVLTTDDFTIIQYCNMTMK